MERVINLFLSYLLFYLLTPTTFYWHSNYDSKKICYTTLLYIFLLNYSEDYFSATLSLPKVLLHELMLLRACSLSFATGNVHTYLSVRLYVRYAFQNGWINLYDISKGNLGRPWKLLGWVSTHLLT